VNLVQHLQSLKVEEETSDQYIRLEY
jgi:hypothetical protein